MLGKLLKQEFRATGRIMLPAFGALLVLSVLANFSIRLLDRGITNNTFLRIILILIIVAFGLSLFGIFLVTLILMVSRFYRNLLGNEGYLMHALPVSVHELVWAKLIVSLVWFAASALLFALIVSLSALIQSGSSLSEVLKMLPNWEQIKALLATKGITAGDLSSIAVLVILLGIVGGLANCLHFYAAMSIGHMFNRDKVLLSVVVFVAFSILMTMFSNATWVGLANRLAGSMESANSYLEGLHVFRRLLLLVIGFESFEAVVMYVCTALSLRRGLNLA